MFHSSTATGDRAADYRLAVEQVKSLWEKDLPLAGNLANISAHLKQLMDRTNWVGFYLWDAARGELLLGPFQGMPACTRIGLGKGVCGTAVSTRKTQRVADVHQFPGHIACDSASESEIVIPLVRDGVVLGVLDIDSPEKGRFDDLDQEWLERAAAALVALWPTT
jgi:L-methionine (R)-S-oxide reductase